MEQTISRATHHLDGERERQRAMGQAIALTTGAGLLLCAAYLVPGLLAQATVAP
jgi:hypothetical protein